MKNKIIELADVLLGSIKNGMSSPVRALGTIILVFACMDIISGNEGVIQYILAVTGDIVKQIKSAGYPLIILVLLIFLFRK